MGNLLDFYISTHAPLAGRDGFLCPVPRPNPEFQPTRPLRGATARFFPPIAQSRHFNPRAPCGARPFLVGDVFPFMIFQPTRPLRGATGMPCTAAAIPSDFNPRAPCGARRSMWGKSSFRTSISTHAPLAGRDSTAGLTNNSNLHISTHAPLAGRDQGEQKRKPAG